MVDSFHPSMFYQTFEPCSVTRKILLVSQKKTGNLKEKTNSKFPPPTPPPKKKKRNNSSSKDLSLYLLRPSPQIQSFSVTPQLNGHGVPSHRKVFRFAGKSINSERGKCNFCFDFWRVRGQNYGRCVLLRLLLKNVVLHEKFRGHPPTPNLNVEAENNGFKKRTRSFTRHLFFRWTILNFWEIYLMKGFFLLPSREKKHHMDLPSKDETSSHDESRIL